MKLLTSVITAAYTRSPPLRKPDTPDGNINLLDGENGRPMGNFNLNFAPMNVNQQNFIDIDTEIDIDFDFNSVKFDKTNR